MNATFSTRAAVAVLAGFLGSLASPLVRAQSLADVARKEEERRKTVAQPAKVYTNKDLSPTLPGSQPAASTPATGDAKGGTDAKPVADAKDGAAAKDAKDTAADTGEKKDQAYWAGKLKALQQQLERDQQYADAMQTKINALTTDFVNRDDPAQRRLIEVDRTKTLAELARLKKAIVDDNKAIAGLQEEARRAGVPPGWLR
jgi:hypothetical protein